MPSLGIVIAVFLEKMADRVQYTQCLIRSKTFQLSNAAHHHRSHLAVISIVGLKLTSIRCDCPERSFRVYAPERLVRTAASLFGLHQIVDIVSLTLLHNVPPPGFLNRGLVKIA